MANRQVYTCDNCNMEIDPDKLSGMTASVAITEAGSFEKRAYVKTKDFCQKCLKVKQEQITEAFDRIMREQ